MPKNLQRRRPSETRKFSKTLFKPKPEIVLKENANNNHVKTINTIFSNAKTHAEKIKKLKFSASFFAKKEKSFKKILDQIANQVPAENIFRNLEDFDIAEYKFLGAKTYSKKIAIEITKLREAFNYAQTLIRRLK